MTDKNYDGDCSKWSERWERDGRGNGKFSGRVTVQIQFIGRVQVDIGVKGSLEIQGMPEAEVY